MVPVYIPICIDPWHSSNVLMVHFRGQLKGLQQTFLSMLQNSTEDHDLKNEAESLDWASVIEQYTEYIRDTDAAKAKRSRFHNVMRKGSEIAGALNTFTSMIPDEKGLSVLRVGLAYILLVSSFEPGDVDKA